MSDVSANNKRIAKNTLVLYVRMLFLMGIGLYTSRVILYALGVEDFGVYNVVGGFVALFAVLSKSMSSAATRFLNFEMGRGHQEKLKNVFSTILIIHVALVVIIAFLLELIGVWFVNNKMVIPEDRLYAANWVFQLSLLTFCLNLIIVPYNAAIIAHEKMSAFAYISVFEGVGKLLIAYLVMVSPMDKLILYAILMFLIQFVVRTMYQIYCKRHFSECVFHFVIDKPLLKEIFGYATWNMIGTSSAILRNQGGNVLINVFCGPVVNAARAVANQVLHAVDGFVNNFVIALKPQITKSYASGEWDYMMSLIYQGSRLSYYMLLFLSLPILVNTDYLLHLWLKEVPDHSVPFVQLTLMFSMAESISHPLVTAQLATGKIRNYQLVVGGLQMMNLPVSYILLRLGGAPETILFVAIFFSLCCLAARLYMLRSMINLNATHFLYKVIINVVVVTFLSSLIPLYINSILTISFQTFLLVSLSCIVSSVISIMYVGCNQKERSLVYSKVLDVIRRKYGKLF
jgi:O-antigen/teichoic acid export membrane protein